MMAQISAFTATIKEVSASNIQLRNSVLELVNKIADITMQVTEIRAENKELSKDLDTLHSRILALETNPTASSSKLDKTTDDIVNKKLEILLNRVCTLEKKPSTNSGSSFQTNLPTDCRTALIQLESVQMQPKNLSIRCSLSTQKQTERSWCHFKIHQALKAARTLLTELWSL